MQFLADVSMQCPVCRGTRYREDILKIRYRDRSIADVLDMTVREAHLFFRGHAKVQQRLRRMMDVGLDYIKLGQPATTLSSGEGQRLKLAAFLASASRRRTLFLLDEPTTGLHFADIVRLVDCFDALLADGHSLVVVEHHSMLMQAADYLIDSGAGRRCGGGKCRCDRDARRGRQGANEPHGRDLAKTRRRLIAFVLAHRSPRALVNKGENEREFMERVRAMRLSSPTWNSMLYEVDGSDLPADLRLAYPSRLLRPPAVIPPGDEIVPAKVTGHRDTRSLTTALPVRLVAVPRRCSQRRSGGTGTRAPSFL